MAIETPKYKVLEKDKKFELRAYDPYITAEVEVEGTDFRDAASRGFSPLARYIFGGNQASQKISMTAPVSAQSVSEKIAMTAPVAVTRQNNVEDNHYRVSFMMPSKFSLETLPKPVDNRVKFHEHPARNMAVIRFSGPFQQPNFEHRLSQLRAWLKDKGLQEAGLPVVAGYDPPFTPWFLKRNEIMIEIESSNLSSRGK
jgi:effector-binding domain-containing protein